MARPFAFSNMYYQRLLRIIGVAGCVLPLVIVGFGALVAHGVLDNKHYAGSTAYIAISIGLVVCSLINFYYVARRQSPPIPVYIALAATFHILSVLFLLFVSGAHSPFLFGWILLAIAVDIYFGLVASLASMAILCGTIFAAFLLDPNMSSQDQLSLVVAVVLILGTVLTVSRLRAINDEERVDLSLTRDRAAFQKERLLALINSMGDAVITTDDEGVITVYNAATLSLLDTNKNIQGKHIDDILHLHDTRSAKVSVVTEARKRRRVFSRSDLVHTFSDGETLNLYLNVAPVQPGYQAQGERGYIFVLRDITKDKSLEEERDEFISVVSHELRTPVAIAEGTISNLMILQGRNAAKNIIQTAAKDAHDQILYLAKLVNDLSTLSRAERGVGSETEVVDLNIMIEDLYKEYASQASAKGLTLDLSIQTKLPRLRTSKLYLEEILHNLITNALKYTREGNITVSATKQNGDLHISVIDTGIGMSKFDQRHIFQKFYRSEDYRTRETSGTGLGLYVCKKLAEKLKVALTFESRLNHGSTFSIIIPKAQFTDEPADPKGPAGFVATK